MKALEMVPTKAEKARKGMEAIPILCRPPPAYRTTPSIADRAQKITSIKIPRPSTRQPRNAIAASLIAESATVVPGQTVTLAGWVANSQDIKPGNRMPPYQQLSGADLLAISAYLEGLK